jgi:N,N'-diacetyllegionaminate synthase
VTASPIIIAEAGVNHNGDLGRAKEMVCVAADSGADYVKFQAFQAENLVATGTKAARYQSKNTNETDQFKILHDLELSESDFGLLADECHKQGIKFFCTAFEVDMIERLVAMGMDRIKIASGELTNGPALVRFAKLGLPVLLSTGMATMDEVADAVAILAESGAAEIIPLHCTSIYPAGADTLNLRAMMTMSEVLNLRVGYSDHSLGDYAAIAAVALGASVIEKHFTLDRALPGPDHPASLEPAELVAMIDKLRKTAKALGDGVKRPVPEELETAALVRRSWHASRDLKAGQKLTQSDLVLKRPAVGLMPADCPVGHTLCNDIGVGMPITRENLIIL